MQEISRTPVIEKELVIKAPDMKDLSAKIQNSGNATRILDRAAALLSKVNGQWQPAGVYQWFPFECNLDQQRGVITGPDGRSVALDLGHSLKFLDKACFVMAFVYTIGETIDHLASQSTSSGQMLDAYLIDLIGLTALEKTCNAMTDTAETLAAQMGWGVSPFLSPGSIHGWDLDGQGIFAQLLPIEKIGVELKAGMTLYPLKSIAAMVGIGPAYAQSKVGSTCQVCTNRHTCQMKPSRVRCDVN